MKKDKELGASTDAGEVGTLAVSLTGLATRRVARTTVSPSAAPGLTDGSNMAKAVVTRDVAGCRSMWIHDSSHCVRELQLYDYDNPSRTVRLTQFGRLNLPQSLDNSLPYVLYLPQLASTLASLRSRFHIQITCLNLSHEAS